MDLGLAGQSIIVTGGSSGIGLETARLLLSEGAFVTICGRDLARLGDAESELASPRLRVIQADVLELGDTGRLVEAAIEHGGRLDGVAAVAGRGRRGDLLDLETSEVVGEVSDKLLSLLNIVQPAVPALTQTAGRIVGLTAPTAFQPMPQMGAIGVGRAALDNAMASLAIELAPSGIRVNAVGVGIIDTPRQQYVHSNSDNAESYEQWLIRQAHARSVPLGRAGLATEVAAAICWLLSPISGYTTGSVLDVTGGLRSR